MGFAELLLLAVGLSMDAFAVSVCKGLATGKVRLRHMLCVGIWFGGFQALMPTLGNLLARPFKPTSPRWTIGWPLCCWPSSAAT